MTKRHIRPVFSKGERAIYYNSEVTILETNAKTAYVRKGQEKFSVDYRLLSKQGNLNGNLET